MLYTHLSTLFHRKDHPQKRRQNRHERVDTGQRGRTGHGQLDDAATAPPERLLVHHVTERARAHVVLLQRNVRSHRGRLVEADLERLQVQILEGRLVERTAGVPVPLAVPVGLLDQDRAGQAAHLTAGLFRLAVVDLVDALAVGPRPEPADAVPAPDGRVRGVQTVVVFRVRSLATVVLVVVTCLRIKIEKCVIVEILP